MQRRRVFSSRLKELKNRKGNLKQGNLEKEKELLIRGWNESLSQQLF
jgi:hypothetical protein